MSDADAPLKGGWPPAGSLARPAPKAGPLSIDVPAALLARPPGHEDTVAPEWAVANAVVGELRRLLPGPGSATTALCMALFVVGRAARVGDEFVGQVERTLRLLFDPPRGEA